MIDHKDLINQIETQKNQTKKPEELHKLHQVQKIIHKNAKSDNQ